MAREEPNRKLLARPSASNIHPSFFRYLSRNFHKLTKMGTLSAGQNLPVEVCDPFIKVMGDVIVQMNCMQVNQISMFERAPVSQCCFKNFIEGVSAQPNHPPH